MVPLPPMINNSTPLPSPSIQRKNFLMDIRSAESRPAADLVLPILRRSLTANQRLSAAERTHCQALMEANERWILGQGTPADLVLLNANRLKHGLGPLAHAVAHADHIG